MSSVATRRRLILEAISRQRIETQEQMVTALGALGIDASQASISRDIAALGLVKSDGRWTAPPTTTAAPIPPEERIAGRLLGIDTAGDHLLVLRTPPGEAGGVALALDGLALEGVVGTVAGDDTIFVATVDAEAGSRAAKQLEMLMST